MAEVDREEFTQIGAEYAAGGLSPDEKSRFEDYLQQASPEELTILSEMLGVSSLLPLTLSRRNPPEHVKRKLMQQVHISATARSAVSRRTSAGLPKRSWLPIGVTVASLAMVAAFSFFVMHLMGTIESQNHTIFSLDQEKKALAVQLVALKDEVTRKEELLKVLASKRIEIVVMNGLTPNPVGYGKVLWDPERKMAILQVSNLTVIPQDKDYQLWVVKGKQPVSAGVFTVSGTEANFFKIENLAVTNPKEISAFAVTLDPKGGMPQPTSEMYMAGSPTL